MESISSQQSFLALLATYPSPHNGQPMRLLQTSDSAYDVFFERERGLQAADISLFFSFVSMGVFVQFAEACGTALGHDISHQLHLPKESELKGTGAVKFAELKIGWGSNAPDVALHDAINFRQTSRKKYAAGLDDETADALQSLVRNNGMNLSRFAPAQAAEAIWLNQHAVFDDMFDKAVNEELDHWLRYTKAEKEQKRDGLAYDCMEINGNLMRFIIKHPGIVRAPVSAQLIKKYYLRTMVDKSDVFYTRAPFRTEQDAFKVGQTIIDIWLHLSARGYYLHPFGTIMSNHAAHADFLQLAEITDESRDESYLVFIFRAGTSEVPVRSLRLPYETHLIMEKS